MPERPTRVPPARNLFVLIAPAQALRPDQPDSIGR